MKNADDTPHFDPEAVHAKYLEERDKRLIEGRAAIRDLTRTRVHEVPRGSVHSLYPP